MTTPDQTADRVTLELELHGERGEAWLLSVPRPGGGMGWCGKSLVVASEGAFAAAREALKRGEHPIVLVSLPRWKAEAEGFIAADDARQGVLL